MSVNEDIYLLAIIFSAIPIGIWGGLLVYYFVDLDYDAKFWGCSRRMIRERRKIAKIVDKTCKQLPEKDEEEEINSMNHKFFINYCIENRISPDDVKSGEAYKKYKEREEYIRSHPPDFKSCVCDDDRKERGRK